MLPSQFFDNLQAFMQPAREVGGDFYDFFKPDADHLCLVMADVSGKGVPAALFMMISKVILQSVAMLGKKPVEILSKTNEALTSNNQVEMFVTVWLGMLNEKTGKLVAVNAGHEFPAIYRAKTKKFELFKDTHCFVVGGMPDIVFKDYTLTLEKGDKLFLYTDGVTEATNSDGQLFGTERLISALNKKPGDSCKNIIETVKKEVDKFVNGAVQFDDITMMCYEYIGPQT